MTATVCPAPVANGLVASRLSNRQPGGGSAKFDPGSTPGTWHSANSCIGCSGPTVSGGTAAASIVGGVNAWAIPAPENTGINTLMTHTMNSR
ncbi:hypothetical protein VXE69_20825 [Mycolicibacterium cosmeticum]